MSSDRNGQPVSKSAEERLAEALTKITELEQRLQDAMAQNAILQNRLRVNNLTGLTNRYGFEEIKARLEEFVTENQFTGHGCFVGIDLDGFKGINDSHGHDVGDLVLKHFAKKLKEKVLEHEVHSPDRVPVMAEAIHPSGDEYGILIVEAVAKDSRVEDRRRKDRGDRKDRRGNPNRLRDEIELLMEEVIRDLIENPLIIDGEDGPISVNHGVSFGIGTFSSPDIESIAVAEKQADERMYEAKRAAHELEADQLFKLVSGQVAFLDCYEKMDEETKNFAKEIIGDRISSEANYRKTGIPENDISISVYSSDSRLPSLISQLDDKAMQWVFPEIASLRTQSITEIGR